MRDLGRIVYTTKKSVVCLVLAFTLVTTVATPLNNSITAVAQAETVASTLNLKNVTGDGGADKISMSNERTFEVTVPLSDSQDATALISAGLTWSLSRQKGEKNDSDFPNQKLGGNLTEWKCYDNTTSLFNIESTKAVTENGKNVIKMTFSNKFLYGSSSVYNKTRNSMLDYSGEYNLECKTSTSDVLGSAKVSFKPYDSYHTTSEFSAELVAAATYAKSKNNMYAEVRSMGQSTNGLDMPYIIIAKNKSVVDNWKKLLARAEENPDKVKQEIKNGKLKYQVPVLYSNVHADEASGADAPMNFIWDIVKSDKTNDKINYKTLSGLTEAGKTKLETQRTTRGQHTSELIKKWVTYNGAITPDDDSNESGTITNLSDYYKVSNKQLNVNKLLDDVFFIIVPEENVDGRTVNTRTGGSGVDLNRDALFQIQNETQNMAAMVAEWNPVTFAEFHGFHAEFQIEPCSPPHEPNVEYDLFAEMGVKGGEAFGAAAVANNKAYNSYQMPLRDYLTTDKEGKANWQYLWDDMSTNHTPQYSMLHGTVAYTIEVPTPTEDTVIALEHGMMGHSQQVADNKKTYITNILECFKRGIENKDADSVRAWYVDVHDKKAAEANVYRPRTGENKNFFPEYYVIPVDSKNQRNLSAAYELEKYLIRNKVKVSKLTEDVKVSGKTYKKGSIVINMHQANRNVANAVLYDGVLITAWSDLYSEPITAFDKTRGFDCSEIRKVGAFNNKLKVLKTAESGKTSYVGKKGNAVVISNSGTSAVKAVNELLSKGKQVGYITEGKYIGDFAVSYDDFASVKSKYVLSASGVTTSPVCKEIKNPTIYIASKPALAKEGYVNYNIQRDNNYNFNRIAFTKQMGFTVTDDPSKADLIYVYTEPSSTEKDAIINAVKAGTPIIITRIANTGDFLSSVFPSDAMSQMSYVNTNENFDWLTTVKYVSKSAVTDSYVADKDNIMYGYGGNYFTQVPTDAKVLIKTTKDEPMEGFFQRDALDAFKGQIVAFEYQKDNRDITVFADTITNKDHQQDDYRYVSNAIFSKTADEELVIPTSNK